MEMALRSPSTVATSALCCCTDLMATDRSGERHHPLQVYRPQVSYLKRLFDFGLKGSTVPDLPV